MIPKEEALKLIYSFYYMLPNNGSTEGINSTTRRFAEAIQCALITVNKMLNDHLSNKTTKYGRERYHFWQQVKHEIKSYDNK